MLKWLQGYSDTPLCGPFTIPSHSAAIPNNTNMKGGITHRNKNTHICKKIQWICAVKPGFYVSEGII
jgi:hypothetical protein